MQKLQTSFNSYLTSMGAGSAETEAYNSIFTMINNDIQTKMPTTFEIYSIVVFNDGIYTSSEEVIKLAGDIPSTILTYYMGLDPVMAQKVNTYSIETSSTMNVEFGNEYYTVPAF